MRELSFLANGADGNVGTHKRSLRSAQKEADEWHRWVFDVGISTIVLLEPIFLLNRMMLLNASYNHDYQTIVSLIICIRFLFGLLNGTSSRFF